MGGRRTFECSLEYRDELLVELNGFWLFGMLDAWAIWVQNLEINRTVVRWLFGSEVLSNLPIYGFEEFRSDGIFV